MGTFILALVFDAIPIASIGGFILTQLCPARSFLLVGSGPAGHADGAGMPYGFKVADFRCMILPWGCISSGFNGHIFEISKSPIRASGRLGTALLFGFLRHQATLSYGMLLYLISMAAEPGARQIFLDSLGPSALSSCNLF